VQYLTGDASTPVGPGVRLIAHVVNDEAHSWGGAGFARDLARAEPQAAAAYRSWTIASMDNLRLGNVHCVETSSGVVVASMVAQHGFGDSARRRLSYSALSSCLEQVAAEALRRDASVHLPKIGTGQAGGLWDLVAEEIDRTLCSQRVQVTVYTKPQDR